MKYCLLAAIVTTGFIITNCSSRSKADSQPSPSISQLGPGSLYENFATLKVIVRDQQFLVVLETRKGKVTKETINDPESRLFVTNLATNKKIFERPRDDVPITLYTSDQFEMSGACLVVQWQGSSQNHIEILQMTSDKVSVVLEEPYRDEVNLFRVAGKSGSVFISTADSAVSTYYTTRYLWDGHRFQKAGRTPSLHLNNVIESAFK